MSEDVVPGFSREYLAYMQGGAYRASFRPLNDAIASGDPRRGRRTSAATTPA